MFTLRATRQPAFLRQLTSQATTTPSTAIAGRRFAHQDYGSGATKSGEPNPAVDQEHPGPPPPNVGQGKGEQETKKQPSKSENDSANSKSTSSSKPQPKILSENPPADGQESEDVAKHNREMQQRADRPAESVKNEDAKKDKVGSGFWSGQGGRDSEP